MEINFKEILLKAPDMIKSVKKIPDNVVNIDEAVKKIKNELSDFNPESIVVWRRPSSLRVFIRTLNFEDGHFEVDIIKYGNAFLLEINKVPFEEENVLDQGSMGDMFKLYLFDGKFIVANFKNDRIEIPVELDKVMNVDFFKDLFLEGASDCCVLTWRTYMRFMSELKKLGVSKEILRSVGDFFKNELTAWPFKLKFKDSRFLVEKGDVVFQMEIPEEGIPLKHDSLVEFMGFILNTAGSYHSEPKQLENLNKLNDIATDLLVEIATKAKEEAMHHTDPKYAKDLYEKLSKIKVIADEATGEVFIGVPYPQEELIKIKRELVKMLKDGVPKEELPPIADENRRKLGLGDCFVPIQLSPIWCGVSIYLTEEKDKDPVLTKRLLNQIKRLIAENRLYFEENE
ncbi:MAG: hypothetical protein ACTSYR_03470 [Candidatus Odinarchaeia archaeon]